jgi:hypothetical protein
MGPAQRLKVVVGVEVRIHYENGISGSEVETQPPSTCRKKENPDFIISVEPVY